MEVSTIKGTSSQYLDLKYLKSISRTTVDETSPYLWPKGRSPRVGTPSRALLGASEWPTLFSRSVENERTSPRLLKSLSRASVSRAATRKRANIFFSLRSCRSSSVSLFDFWEGHLAGILPEILQAFSGPTKSRLKKIGENFGAFFMRKFVPRKKYFVPTSFCRRATLIFSIHANPFPRMTSRLEAQQRYFSYRAILVAIVSQNFSVLVFMGYRTTIARYVAKWGIAQMCLCKI